MSDVISLDGMIARDRAIDAQMEALRLEKERIRTALDVIREYSGEPLTPAKLTAGERAPRPYGVPTLFEMTETVLAPVDERDGGLTMSGLVDLIRAKYWPGLAAEQIGPSIYRFVKEKRLAKVGDRFRLVKKDKASGG